MGFRASIPVLALLLFVGKAACVTVTAPTVVWDQNNVDLVCNFTGVIDDAALVSVSWYSVSPSDRVYFYNSTTDTAEGALVGRATGALTTGEHTLTVTNATKVGDNGHLYYCKAESATFSSTGDVVLNVAVLCEPSLCLNGGNCSVDSPTSYSCSCPANFTGVNCETDMNAQTTQTTLTPGVTATTATTGTTGTPTVTTVIDECDSSPCVNGGNCTDQIGDYSCACSTCWTGKNCETQAIDECASNPCQNGGSCIDACFEYTCSCPYGSGGTHCEITCSNIASISSARQAIIGSQVTLTCIGTTDAHVIKWSKEADGTSALASGSTYTIRSVAVDEGDSNYYCFSTLNSCTSRDSTKVTATFSVDFNGTEYQNMTVEEGESLELYGELDANPNAMVHWRFTGLSKTKTDGNETEVVTPDTAILGNATLDNATYTISSATADHAGHYECVGELPGGLTYLIKSHWVAVETDDDKKGGLKGWQIALIVIAVILLIAIIAIIIVFVVLKKKGSVEPKDNKDKQRRAENGNDDGLNKSLNGAFRSPRKSARYEKIDSEREEKKAKDEAYHSDMELKPKTKKKRLLKRRTTLDADDDDTEQDGRHYAEGQRPLPDYPVGRGRTLPPLNVEQMKTKPKKKKRVTEEYADERQEDSGRD